MRDRALGLPGSEGRRRDRDIRGARDPTHVGVLILDLHLPASHSLKDKRGVLRPVLEGLRRRYSVAAAEVDHQDRWQRAALGLAAVAMSASHVQEVLDGAERFVWAQPGVEVIRSERQWLDSS